MASPPCFCLLLLLAAITACRAGPLVKDIPPSVISCSTAGNYSDGSEYHKNLYNLLSAIPMAAANNGGFFNGTVGTEVDEVFGLFMCYAGNDDSACLDCLNHAPEGIMELCPHSRTVRAVYDDCTLRYSNESFFSVADLTMVQHVEQSPGRYSNYGAALVAYVVDTAGMRHTRFELIRQLTERAGLGAERVAMDNHQITDAQRMEAVVQCTRDLPANECKRCLSNFTDQLPRLLPNNSGGAIKGYSCYLAYAILTEKPYILQLNRFHESYERNMVTHESEPRIELKKGRRKVAIIVGLVLSAAAVVLCMIGLCCITVGARLIYRRTKQSQQR